MAPRVWRRRPLCIWRRAVPSRWAWGQEVAPSADSLALSLVAEAVPVEGEEPAGQVREVREALGPPGSQGLGEGSC